MFHFEIFDIFFFYGSNCQPFLSFVHSAVTGRHRHNTLLQTEFLQQEEQHLSYTCILEDVKVEITFAENQYIVVKVQSGVKGQLRANRELIRFGIVFSELELHSSVTQTRQSDTRH
jgi:hypothetical protein